MSKTESTLNVEKDNETDSLCSLKNEDVSDETETNNHQLTAELLAEQNELYSTKLLPKPNAIRAWAADLPEVPDTVQPILTTSRIFEMEPINEPRCQNEQARIQETKDVFSETQKIAYVSLCYLTSLEVVHDFEGPDFTYARMSADNWQRKLMKILFSHMDISIEGTKKKKHTQMDKKKICYP